MNQTGMREQRHEPPARTKWRAFETLVDVALAEVFFANEDPPGPLIANPFGDGSAAYLRELAADVKEMVERRKARVAKSTEKGE